MIHFAHPKILLLLLVVAALFAAWVLMRWLRARRLEQFAERSMFGRLMPDASRGRALVKYLLLMLALSMLIIAVANPLMGSRRVKGEHIGSDVAICLDISNSMMAEDIQPNRLERAKRMVSRLLDHFAGDRVALVVFAGSSYVQMPLTNDYSATRLFLDQIDCSMISAQGTAIGDAIEKAMLALGYGDEGWNHNAGRAIIIISDGENHEDDAEQAARDAANEGVVVCTIGMGLPDGAPIPQYDRHGQRAGMKKDGQGNTIMTHLNETMLAEIAQEGSGIYLRGTDINANMDELFDALDALEKEHYDETLFDQYQSQYPYPLTVALVCLLVELLVFERKTRRKHILFLLLLVALPLAGQAQNRATHKALRQGNRHYNKERFRDAADSYRAALSADSNFWSTHYNIGNALYREGEYTTAAQHFSRALERVSDTDTAHRSQILHNRGNSFLKGAIGVPQDDTTQMRSQLLHQAINDYQESLKLDPRNDDTRYNLAYARHLLPKSNGGGGGQNQQNQQQDQNQQNQNQQGQNQQNQNQQKQDHQNGQQKQDQQKKDGQQNPQQGQSDKQQQHNQQQQKENGQKAQKKKDAERILRAVENNEKKSLREHHGEVEAVRGKRTDKDW